jgi:predicted AAA+ superfamily ATPase
MRWLDERIRTDLEKKIVFISGPRQVGKTTLAKSLLSKEQGIYLNFDDPAHRTQILSRTWHDNQRLVILDEIHKYSRWKNFLKGTYDTQQHIHRFLVTGSARLDIYRRGQDSLFGRFFNWRLHPFCLAELKWLFPEKSADEMLYQLMNHSGFPEPFFQANTIFTQRWRNSRSELVFRQDIRDIEQIRDITLLELFRDAIAKRSGQLLVLSNIARDIEIAPKTAAAWLQALIRSYVLFSITSFTAKLSRAIRKPVKAYFFDPGETANHPGNRFENIVALHLLKRIDFLEDSSGRKLTLHFVRDKEGNEVDFLIAEKQKPLCLIEVKLKPEPPRGLLYFSKKLHTKHNILLVLDGDKKTYADYTVEKASDWLAQPLDKEIW